MNILFVVSDLSVEAGGVTTAVCGLAESLIARDHQVTIVGLDMGGTPARPAGVQTRVFARDGTSKLGHSQALEAWLRENVRHFDVVQIHGIWQHPAHYAARWARQYRVPYLVAPHGMLDDTAVRLGRVWVKRIAWLLWDGPMLRRAAAVHCLNEAEYRVSPWIHGLRHVVIGNGIAAGVLDGMPARGVFRQKLAGQLGGVPASQDRPIALFLSRIHPKKGLDRLFAHWATVRAKHPEVLLVIAGTGEPAYVESLHAQCRAAGIEDGVVWVGQLVGRAKYEALVDADVFVLPSHQEGFSMAVTEALAAGCPVVITRPCNFDEVRTADAGLIADDMPTFARAVAELLADGPRRAAMGNNGRKLVRENFTWEIIADKAQQTYTSLRRA